MNTIPYESTLRTIDIPGQEPLEVYTLLDRTQYYDPTGAAKRLGICSAAWPLFGMLWPSGVQLAIKVANNPIPADKKVLEIGCGLGIASLVAQRLGVNITASDRHPMAGHFLNKNVNNNNLDPIPYKYGQWGEKKDVSLADTGAPLLSKSYDLIIGSDLLYEPSSPAEVAEFINRYAKPQAEVWVMDPNRGYRNQFSRSIAQYGFKLLEDRVVRRPFAYSEAEEKEPYSGRFLHYCRA